MGDDVEWRNKTGTAMVNPLFFKNALRRFMHYPELFSGDRLLW
jgi:hypothetical protein